MHSTVDIIQQVQRLTNQFVAFVQQALLDLGLPAGEHVVCIARLQAHRTNSIDNITTFRIKKIKYSVGSTQNWLHSVCVDLQDYEHVCTTVPQPTHQPLHQRTDTTLDSYATAHPTVCSYRLCETFFSMCRAVCLELTSCICHRKRLTVCIQI